MRKLVERSRLGMVRFISTLCRKSSDFMFLAVKCELLGSVLLHEELLKQMFLQNMLIISVYDSCHGTNCAVADRSTVRCLINAAL